MSFVFLVGVHVVEWPFGEILSALLYTAVYLSATLYGEIKKTNSL